MAIRDLVRPLSLFGWCCIVLLIVVRGAYAASSCSADCPGDINNDRMVTVDEILGAVNAALTGCPPVGPTPSSSGGLLQTGQTQCDQGTGTLGACPGSPLGQDGTVGAGVPPNYTDNGDGTIRDNVTALVWEKLSDDGGVHDWDNAYTWHDAIAVKIAALNKPPCFAGHCDWRLPNRRELESLVDVGRANPAIDPLFNTGCTAGCDGTACGCTQSDYYWSSTSYQDPTLLGLAWNTDFAFGGVAGFDKTLAVFFARAVRGGL